MARNFRPAREIVEVRANFLELVSTAIVLALGVNIATTGILEWTKFSAPVVSFVGLALVLGSIMFISLRMIPRVAQKYTFEGVVLSKGEENEVLSADRYDFSEELKDSISAITSENKAIGRIWKENPLSRIKDEKSGHLIDSPAMHMVREAVEYYFIHSLSLHLNAYFIRNSQVSSNKIENFGRRDMPSVLLENRFLDLFSRPMDEREAFSVHAQDDLGQTVFAYGLGGAIFERIELTLPQGTKVLRRPNGSVEIDTKRFKLTFRVEFEGYSIALTSGFVELYLNENYIDVSMQEVRVHVDLEFYPRGFLTKAGWEYYQWVDEFLSAFDQKFSVDSFLEQIGWEKALTAAYATRSLDQASRRPRKRPEVDSFSITEIQDDEVPREVPAKKASATARRGTKRS